jgi:hypothetical protein
MLDIAGVLVVVAYFVGCELYVRYCDTLLEDSQRDRGDRRG